MFRRKYHTNVKNGGAEWMEGMRKPVEVVCVDSAMAVRGRAESRDTDSDLIGRRSAWGIGFMLETKPKCTLHGRS